MIAQRLTRALLILFVAASFCGGSGSAQAEFKEFPRYLDLSDHDTIQNKHVRVGRYKSLVVSLPREAGDVLVSNPDIADAVLRTATRLK